MPYWNDPGVNYDDTLIRFNESRIYAEDLNQKGNWKLKTKFDVVLDLRGLSGPQLSQRAKNVAAGIVNKPVFASLVPKITAINELITSVDSFETIEAAKEPAHSNAVAVCDDADHKPAAVPKVIAHDVGSTAATEAQIISAKLRVKGKPTPKPVHGQVTSVVHSFGDDEGEHDASWDGVSEADWYQSRWTSDDPNSATANWHVLSTTKKSSLGLTALPSGQKIWFQVQAANARGEGPWSDPASKRVP
jgi:hypothetical protein